MCFSWMCFHSGFSATLFSKSVRCSSPLLKRFLPVSPAYFELMVCSQMLQEISYPTPVLLQTPSWPVLQGLRYNVLLKVSPLLQCHNSKSFHRYYSQNETWSKVRSFTQLTQLHVFSRNLMQFHSTSTKLNTTTPNFKQHHLALRNITQFSAINSLNYCWINFIGSPSVSFQEAVLAGKRLI